ncbi:MAG: Ig-like domain-containing protein [Candidatus Kariarchaeaceae archaeon]
MRKITLSLFLITTMIFLIAPIGVAAESNMARASYVCRFVEPTSGDTVSGDFAVDFYGTYRGSPLYNVKIAVFKDGSALTSYVDMTYLGSNHWGVTWNTGSFDDGTGYALYALAYKNSVQKRTYAVTSLIISNGGSTPDTENPVATITNPSNGATVGNTVNVAFTATDNVGVTATKISIDGAQKSTGTTYTWDTTAYADGSHTILCEAWDAAGNYGYDQHTVTVDNTVTPPPDNELTSGETVYSNLDAQYATEMWTIEVGSGIGSMKSVLNCGSADFDLYGRLGTEPTTTTYDWRGYTTGGEDITETAPGEGTWYIMVRSYSGTGNYDLTVTLTEPASSDWGTSGNYAIIVGISDYASISDLSYCDEDATDWYYQLNGMGYEAHVWGDSHSSNYPIYNGLATEASVRADILGLAAHAVAGDTVVFTTSGHGSGDGNGMAFLCMYDCSGSTGCYYDTELAADIGQFVAGVNIFIFIDHCYSGGMGPELMALGNAQYILVSTTCTEDGYGWDDGSSQNGAWTYYFLDYSWQSHFGGTSSTSMETVHAYAKDDYPHTGGDTPMLFDGNLGTSFYL